MAVKTYGKIYLGKGSLTNNFWLIETQPHVRIRIKNMFAKIPKFQTDVLMISNTDDNCMDLEWFMQRYPMEMTEEDRILLTQRSNNFREKQVSLEQIFLPDYKPQQIKLALPLREYQLQGVDLHSRAMRVLVGDDLGLGKTAIGIAACLKHEGPSLVVCQTHLPLQWVAQIKKFAPDATTHVVKKTTPYELPKADIYLISYSKLSGWTDLLSTGYFKNVVFDEIQELRIPDSNKYIAAMGLSKSASYVLGLSATPVYNYGGEIFAIMEIIKPGALGTFEEFIREWGSYSYEKVKVKDPQALGAYLREQYMFLRRTRKDVGKELPPINRIVHHVEYSMTDYKNMQKTLSQIASTVLSGTFVERGQASRELDIRMRQMTGVAKAAGVADYVRILLENNEPVLLAGWHREVYEIWLDKLKEYNPLLYTGSESPKQKHETAQKFINGETNLMIISLRSGAGLDGLQERCSTVVFGEPDWSPGVHNQVIGRLQRDGQGQQVTAIYLMTDMGSDPVMIDILGLKAAQAEGIVNPNNEIITVHSDDDRIKKLAKNLLGLQG